MIDCDIPPFADWVPRQEANADLWKVYNWNFIRVRSHGLPSLTFMEAERVMKEEGRNAEEPIYVSD